jgi:hypothetical protein
MNFISSIFPYSTTVGFNSRFKIIEIKIIKLHFLQSLQPFPDRNQFPILIYFALSVPLTVWRKKNKFKSEIIFISTITSHFMWRIISIPSHFRAKKNQESEIILIKKELPQP